MLHCRQRKTEPQPQLTCTEHSVKFGHSVFRHASGQCRHTDRQTDGLIAMFRTSIVGEVINDHAVGGRICGWAMLVDRSNKHTTDECGNTVTGGGSGHVPGIF